MERLAKISRSPIFADFSQSLTGPQPHTHSHNDFIAYRLASTLGPYSVPTAIPYADMTLLFTHAGASSIRTYKAQQTFINSASHSMDLNNGCVLVGQLCFCWLSFRLDILGASILCFIVALAVLTEGMVYSWMYE